MNRQFFLYYCKFNLTSVNSILCMLSVKTVLKINRNSNLGKQPLYFLFTFVKHRNDLVARECGASSVHLPSFYIQDVRFEGGGGVKRVLFVH